MAFRVALRTLCTRPSPSLHKNANFFASPLCLPNYTQQRRFVTITPEGVRQYTREEVAAHDTEEDCWLIIDNKVYDVSQWLALHPGGRALLARAGRDSTTLFHSAPHTNWTQEVLPKYYIGELVPSQKGHRFTGQRNFSIPDESI